MTTHTNIIRILRNIAFSLVAILLAIGSIVFLQEKIALSKNAIEENKHLTAILVERNQLIYQLQKDYGVIGGGAQTAKRALLPVDNVSEFIATLQSLALKYSLGQSVNIGTPTVTGTTFGNPTVKIVATPWSIMFSANNRITLQYLKELEKVPYFSTIDSIVLSAPSGGVGASAQVTIQGTLFTQLTDILSS